MIGRYAIAGLAVLLAACGSEAYQVGVWAGPTGANVARLAEHEINFSGGSNGRRISVDAISNRAVLDAQLTPELLAASLDSMAADTMTVAMITRVLDDVTEAATAKYEAAGIPYLVLNPVSESYAATHPHAFLLSPSIEDEARFIAEHTARADLERIAIIHVRDRYGEAMRAALTESLERRGGRVIHTGRYYQDADEATVTAIGYEAASKRPTSLFWIGRSPSLELVFGYVLNRVPGIAIYGTDLMESFQLYQSPRRFAGLRFVRLADPASDQDSIMISLRDRQMIWIGRNELTTEAVLTFDAMRLIDYVMDRGAGTREQITAALRELGRNTPAYKGVAGTFSFDAGQRAGLRWLMSEVTPDQVRTMDSVVVATPN